ncbi:MAG: sensor histidine kinase [Anaerolineae bacterium]
MRKLRTRLILSHIIPLVIIAPLLGLTVYYLLLTQQQLTALSAELTQHAQLVAQLAQNRPDIWSDESQAKLFVEVFTTEEDPDPHVSITLLRPGGQTLATSQAAGLGETPMLALPELGAILAEERGYLRVQADLANVLVPVVDAGHEVLGLVSLTAELDTVTARVPLVRNLLIVALVAELLLGTLVGLRLSLKFERDLQAMTTAVAGISSGHPLQRLPERGPAEFRALFQAYNRMVDRLKSLEDARHQLLANMVHELGRPLGALHAAVQALRQGGEEDPAFRQELLEGMEGQINRLRPLLDNLAELHGQLLGTLELNRQITPMADWLRRVAAPWQAAAREKGVQWRADIPDTLPMLSIDGDRLAQAVGNLLSNGIKYTPPGGTVRLFASATDAAVLISVSDTGPGITPEEQGQVFAPFYRSRSDTRFPQGIGLGLTIAHDIVAAHGGRLELTSERGAGSRFTITLPRVPRK